MKKLITHLTAATLLLGASPALFAQDSEQPTNIYRSTPQSSQFLAPGEIDPSTGRPAPATGETYQTEQVDNFRRSVPAADSPQPQPSQTPLSNPSDNSSFTQDGSPGPAPGASSADSRPNNSYQTPAQTSESDTTRSYNPPSNQTPPQSNTATEVTEPMKPAGGSQTSADLQAPPQPGAGSDLAGSAGDSKPSTWAPTGSDEIRTDNPSRTPGHPYIELIGGLILVGLTSHYLANRHKKSAP